MRARVERIGKRWLRSESKNIVELINVIVTLFSFLVNLFHLKISCTPDLIECPVSISGNPKIGASLLLPYSYILLNSIGLRLNILSVIHVFSSPVNSALLVNKTKSVKAVVLTLPRVYRNVELKNVTERSNSPRSIARDLAKARFELGLRRLRDPSALFKILKTKEILLARQRRAVHLQSS
jgi:hypothetical protein